MHSPVNSAGTAYPEIVGIGSSVYDVVMVVSGFPQEDTKKEGAETIVQGGGPCATALVAASKLGVSSAYLGILGDDSFGRFLLGDLDNWGVDTRYVRCMADQVSFHAMVLLNRENASRTCIWSRGTVEPLKPGDVNLDLLHHAKVLHLDGHMPDAALFAAKYCKELGVKVSYDAGGIYPGVDQLLPYVDYLIPSEEFALEITHAADAQSAATQLMQTYGPEIVVITQGVRGGIILDDKGLRRYNSYKVEVRDSNGSGDTFHGAFIAARIKGMDADQACAYASAAAAIKCTRLGARSGMPNDEECRAFLMERGTLL